MNTMQTETRTANDLDAAIAFIARRGIAEVLRVSVGAGGDRPANVAISHRTPQMGAGCPSRRLPPFSMTVYDASGFCLGASREFDTLAEAMELTDGELV